MADEDGTKKMFKIQKKFDLFFVLIRYSTIGRYSGGKKRRTNTGCEVCGNTTERYCIMKNIFEFD